MLGRSVVTAAVLLAGNSLLLSQTEEREQPAPVKRIKAKNANLVLQLEGGSGETFSHAFVKWPSGKKTLIRRSDTSILDAQISNDGRYVVLEQHISSGGFVESFERTNKGFRPFLDNGYAFHEIKAGRVEGLSQNDIPIWPGKNSYHGFFLAESPTRFVFMFGAVLAVDYSLGERRITGWKRTLLEASATKGNTRITLSIREASPDRRLEISLRESTTETEKICAESVIARFEPAKPKLEAGRLAETLHAKQGQGKDSMQMTANKVKDEFRSSEWQVELQGAGKQFTTLKKRLQSAWDRFEDKNDKEGEWPEPLKFKAFTPDPVR